MGRSGVTILPKLYVFKLSFGFPLPGAMAAIERQATATSLPSQTQTLVRSESRSRFAGGQDSMVDVLARHFDSPGFMNYGPNLDVVAAAKYKALILDLYNLQSNLSFTQQHMKTAMEAVVAEKHWKMKDKDGAFFSKAVAIRIRTLLRHVQQAKIKRTAWALDVLDIQKTDESADVGGGYQGSIDQGSADYFYGFDWAMSLPWRTNIVAKGVQEFGVKLQEPPGTDPFAEMIGVWGDGHSHAISELTRSPWQLSSSPMEATPTTATATQPQPVLKRPASSTTKPAGAKAARKDANSAIWEGAHKGGGAVRVVWRRDHQLLCRVYHGKESVCMISEHRVGYNKELAEEIMTKVAIGYANGEVGKGDLYAWRDQFLGDALFGGEPEDKTSEHQATKSKAKAEKQAPSESKPAETAKEPS